MNCSLPYWMHVLQAMLTPAIAFLAVVIGWGQWRTAQQKVVLDLFDRRLGKHTAFRGIVRQVMGAGAATQETSFQFAEAMDGVEFLFGDEIVSSLTVIYKAIVVLAAIGPELKEVQDGQGPGPELQALNKKSKRH
jgi:hypothetical protein